MRDDTQRMPLGAHRVAAASHVDDAQAVLESVFPPLRMQPHGHGKLSRRVDMAFNSLRIGKITASCLQFGRGIHIAADEVTNFYVNVPLSGVAKSRTGRRPPVLATSDRGAVFLPELPAEVDWSDGCTQFCLGFPRHAINLELEAMLDRPVGEPVEFAPAVDLTTEPGRAWLATLQLLDQQSQGQPSLLGHPVATANLEALLIANLLLTQPHNYTAALGQPQRSSAPTVVRRAIELVRAHPEQAWTTAKLAREAAVSARCLQEGFQRCVGMPPMRYLREVRLDRVHSDLLTADPASATVAQIARRWGFVYLGRFAATYRQKFGQTPSRTLRGRE